MCQQMNQKVWTGPSRRRRRRNASSPLQMILSVKLCLCLCEQCWAFLCPSSIAQHFWLRTFSRSTLRHDLRTVELSVGKLLVHSAVCDFWCCGVVFFYSGFWGLGGSGQVGLGWVGGWGQRGLVFQNKTYLEMLLYVDEGLLLLLAGFGDSRWSRLRPLVPWEVKFSVYLHVSKASAKDWWLFI